MSYWPWPGTTTILEVKCTTSTILSTWAPRSIAMLSLLVTLGSNSMKKLFNLPSGHRLIIIHSDGGNTFGKRGPELILRVTEVLSLVILLGWAKHDSICIGNSDVHQDMVSND